MNIEEMRTKWTAEARKLLKNRKIVDAQYIPDKEFGTTLAIVLDNGTMIFPMRDDEGNGPGALHMQTKDGKQVGLPVLREY